MPVDLYMLMGNRWNIYISGRRGKAERKFIDDAY